MEQVSAEDPELQVVRKCLIDGKWDSAPKQYLHVRNELTYTGHVMLRGTRIVVPQVLTKTVVNLAHEGHQGVVKTKERLTTKDWWPKNDRDAERRCAECYGCQLDTKNVPPPPVKPTPLPEQPWQELALDLKEMGVEHRYTTPLWPRANGEVERQNRSPLKSIRAAHAEGKDWREELNKFLLEYRSTPHSTTGRSAAELLFKQKLSTKMP